MKKMIFVLFLAFLAASPAAEARRGGRGGPLPDVSAAEIQQQKASLERSLAWYIRAKKRHKKIAALKSEQLSLHNARLDESQRYKAVTYEIKRQKRLLSYEARNFKYVEQRIRSLKETLANPAKIKRSAQELKRRRGDRSKGPARK